MDFFRKDDKDLKRVKEQLQAAQVLAACTNATVS